MLVGDVQKRATQSVFEEADVASFRLCGTVKREFLDQPQSEDS